MNPTEKRLLTIKEFCALTRISRTTLYRHMRTGAVPYTKIGGRVLIASQIVNDLARQAGENDEHNR
jgi:excisionase family DNA binding protein